MRRLWKVLIVGLVAVVAIGTAALAAGSKGGSSGGGNSAAQLAAPKVAAVQHAALPSPTQSGYEPPPVETDELAWCSPGYWKTHPAAWAQTGFTSGMSFNATVVAGGWYGTALVPDRTLAYVLANPSTGQGESAGSKGYSLTAFNAIGAMLTDATPGLKYSSLADAKCPLS